MGDDPITDWDTAAPTVADDPVTAPHNVTRLPGYEVGRKDGRELGFKAGFVQGRDETLAVLRLAFQQFEQSGDVAAHVEAWIRARLPPV